MLNSRTGNNEEASWMKFDRIINDETTGPASLL
jgi:hypothetical protein